MLGDRIKALRCERKITQETLAKHLFISPQAVSRWEQGLALPDTAILIALADFFGVSVDYLLRDFDQKTIADYSAAFEIKTELRPDFTIIHFTNISTYTFRRVEFKVKFWDKHNSVMDYKTNSFYDSEPEATKVIRTVNFRYPKASQVTVSITSCDLA